MKIIIQSAAIVFSVIAFSSCQKDIRSDNNASAVKNFEFDNNIQARNSGINNESVYTLSNQMDGNKVMVYRHTTDGSLAYHSSYATGGQGTGGGLGNQGAVVVTYDKDVVLAVNPGSNSISSLKITGSGLNLKSIVSSGGTTPVSITQHGDLVYVLNSGGTGNISGFRLGTNEKLTPIANSTRPLSSMTAGAAQISFVRDGKVLVITEKATNKIITYTVDNNGLPQAMHSIMAASNTPFGFATGKYGNIYVSEAVGGAPNGSNVSSYNVAADGSISLTQGPVATTQTAACWVVITKDNNYIYTTNTGSNSVSSFDVMPMSGNISLLQAAAGATQMGPIDAAISSNSNYLYVLNAVSHSISVFGLANNGSLTHLQTMTGLPAGATGMATN